MTSSAAQRRRTAYAEAAAAKQRRSKILAIAGFVLFLAVAAYEVPHTLKLLNHKSATVAAPAAAPTSAAPRTIPKALRRSANVDPFSGAALVGNDPTVGPAGRGHDPFAVSGAGAGAGAAAPPAAVTLTGPLPKQIVIGTPTKNGSVARGWIVILASIPTRQGQKSALAFARAARRRGIRSISVLNSSNRRPLRGGYWVVYTNPVPTLVAAEHRASSVHASGYGTAYLRELVKYR